MSVLTILLTCPYLTIGNLQHLQVLKTDATKIIRLQNVALANVDLPMLDDSQGYAFELSQKKYLLTFEPVTGNWVLVENYQHSDPRVSFQTCY